MGTKSTKKGQEILTVLDNKDGNLKYQCLLCKGTTPHLMAIMNKDGDIHVHGPFSNKVLMQDFISAIEREKIAYNKSK